MSIATGDDNAACIAFDLLYGIEFPTLSGVEGGGTQICNTYGIGAYPTYILIAPDHTIVEQDIWPMPSTQTLIDAFEGHGIVQSDCSAVSAGFMSDATEICQYDMVSYTDQSSGNITSWNWTFEGGDPATSTEQNPVVTYNEIGSFDVTLEVSDGTETATMFLEDYITVEMTPPVMLTPFDDVSINQPAFELTGGSPAGGEYTGPGVTDNWFDPAVAGLGEHTITYTYTAANGCDNSTDETILVVEFIGIEDVQDEVMHVYPNPAYDKIELNVNYSGNISVEIYNLIGVSVYETETFVNGNFQKSIDLSGMESGVYFVTVRTPEETYIKKLNLLKN